MVCGMFFIMIKKLMKNIGEKMTRREEIDSEIDSYASWRIRNVDYTESVAHLRYVEYLGWKK
jgi:hypothetical protein